MDEGTVLGGRYRLGPLLAQGGMGDVHTAEDVVTGDRVCVKALRGTDPRDVRRFMSESRTLDRLDHPLVVRLLDSGTHTQVPYLVMELIDGPSLRDLMQEGPLDPGEVRGIGRDVAEALAHAHVAGIVHRDVKPANVLIDGDRRAHLADFGIARLADATGVTSTGTAVGTAAYLAPEQLLTAEDVGPWSDVYSLGLLLLEALTGEAAFTGTTTETAFARLHRDPHIPEDLPERWRALLAAMTSRRRESRPAAADVAEALRPGGPYLDVLSTLQSTEELPPMETVAMTAGADAQPAPSPGGRRVADAVRGLWERLRRPRVGVGAVLVAVIAVSGLLAVLAGPRGTESGATDDGTEATADLPEDLERSLDRLEEVVRP